MAVCIITEQGTRLTRRGHALVLYKDGEKIFFYPLANLERIILLGRIEVGAPVFGLLQHENIDLVMLTQDGRFKARVTGPGSKNVFIRQLQYGACRDLELRMAFARTVVMAKGRNAYRVIRKGNSDAADELQPRLKNFERGVEAAADLNGLRGLEGAFSALYFSYFRLLLKNRMGFRKRIKRPPPDPVNILLSFGYTMLFNTLLGLCEAHGMDPFVGMYHDLSYGHAALASDLMEEFRAPVVDRLILAQVNLGIITESGFEKNEQGLRMHKETIGKFSNGYREVMQTRIRSGERSWTYLQLIEEQVNKYKRYLENKEEKYEPFRAN